MQEACQSIGNNGKIYLYIQQKNKLRYTYPKKTKNEMLLFIILLFSKITNEIDLFSGIT